MKSLVLYYSFEGNTENIAKAIATGIDADIEMVKPVKELKSKGFSKFIWGGSQVVMGKKPKIQPINVNIETYDFILIGTPIWAGTYAPPIKTLIENEYIKNKKVAYFYTHEGGHSKAMAKAKESISKLNTFIDGRDFLNRDEPMNTHHEDAITWVQELITK